MVITASVRIGVAVTGSRLIPSLWTRRIPFPKLTIVFKTVQWPSRTCSSFSEKNGSGVTSRISVEKPRELLRFLGESNANGKDGPTCFHSLCFFCGTFPANCGESDALSGDTSRLRHNLHISKTSGDYFCHSCHSHGNFTELRENIDKWDQHGRQPLLGNGILQQTLKDPSDGIQDIPCGSDVVDDFKKIRGNLGFGSVLISSFRAYDIRLTSDRKGFVFPKYVPAVSTGAGNVGVATKDLVVAGLRIFSSDGSTVTYEDIPKDRFSGIFGLNVALGSSLPNAQETLVIANSEFEALALFQATGFPAISLPFLDTQIPFEAVSCLDSHNFKKIYIWAPRKYKSKRIQFAKQLMESRCFYPAIEDDHDLNAMDKTTIQRCFVDAKPAIPEGIAQFEKYKAEVFSDWKNEDVIKGVKWRRFPDLNKILKGFRRGELTVLTGPTGCGKTTFISEYSLDLMENGAVPTCWCSFEIKNARMGKTMLQQLAGFDGEPDETLDDLGLEEEFHQLANDPVLQHVYFLDHHGAMPYQQVIEKIRSNVDSNGAWHVIVDNLQFMIGTSFEGSDKYSQQDKVVSALRSLATELNIHITLIAHPRKLNSSVEPQYSASSFYGSVRTTQEADNILIIQQITEEGAPNFTRFLEVHKNRFDGELLMGNHLEMQFNPRTKCYNLKRKGLNNESTPVPQKSQFPKQWPTAKNWPRKRKNDGMFPDE